MPISMRRFKQIPKNDNAPQPAPEARHTRHSCRPAIRAGIFSTANLFGTGGQSSPQQYPRATPHAIAVCRQLPGCRPPTVLAGVGHTSVHRADTKRVATVRQIVVAGVGNFGDAAVDHANLRVAISAGSDIDGAADRRDRADRQGRDDNAEIAALNDALIGPDLARSAGICGGGRKTGAHSNIGFAEADHLLAGGRRRWINLGDTRRIVGNNAGRLDGDTENSEGKLLNAGKYHADCQIGPMSDLRGARRSFLPRQTGEGINPFSFTKKWLWLQHRGLRVTESAFHAGSMALQLFAPPGGGRFADTRAKEP